MAAWLSGRGVRGAGRRAADRTVPRKREVPPREPVTGGAFCRFDADTAELKRIWTDSRHRRRGHAKALLIELEAEIAARGYRRAYLTTGDRQPEAEALYLSSGYTRLAEPLPAEGDVFPIAFVKRLP